MARYDFDGLESYMSRRHFSNDLKKKYRKTYKLSCKYGDGKIWSDSLLLTSLLENNNTINNIISSIPGSRGNILDSTKFKDTLSTQYFIPDFHTQSILDEEIQCYANKNPQKEISEETILLIEIQLALESMEMNYSALYGYVQNILDPYYDFVNTNSFSNIKNNVLRSAYSDKIIDAFLLSYMLKIHPFDIFDVKAEKHYSLYYLAEYYTGDICKNKFKRFLYLLRDSINVSCRIIPDHILEKIIELWDDKEFLQVCLFDDENYDYASHNDYRNASLYATALLAKENYPLISILNKLERTSYHSLGNNWAQNEKLFIYLDNDYKKIKLLPLDYYGTSQYELKNGIYQKSNYGFYNPNPIWNESIIDTLEYYIEKNELESVFQYFFELYPDFILDDLHVNAISHPILSNSHGKTLKPDFIIQKINTNSLDIIELKRPINNIIHGDNERPRFCSELVKGIAQLKEYKEWFQDKQNREVFYKKYKLDGFNPTLTLIIGRNSGFKNEEVRRRVCEGESINILTYDDIVTISKQRRSRLLS